MLKFISWNVNGLRACYDKGFVDVFHRLEADFFCLQEKKTRKGNWMPSLKVITPIGIMLKERVFRHSYLF